MRWRLVAAILALGVCVGSCTKQDPEPVSKISAAQLGDPVPIGDTLPEHSLAAQLSPGERAALQEQGYEIYVDVDDWEEQARLEAEGLDAQEGETDFDRAMDHAGKATVAFTSVAMAIGMMIAPFFLF